MYKQVSIIFPRAKNGMALALRRFSSETEEIVIPKEIPRGPTDILKALSSTVQRDPTAAHYKYHDDPYLLPYSNLSKRSYALSQEAGRKAAQWIRQQNPELFQHKVAEPVIEAFIPKPTYNEDSNVNEEVLKNSILNICVQDSITIYDLLKKRNIEISLETKQSLLELVCYYNGVEPVSEEWIEERWYRQGLKAKEKWKNLWKDGGFAEQLFNELGGKDEKSVCALISGMCFHGQIDKARKLYEQAKTTGLKLNTSTINLLISKSCFLKENHVMIMESLQELLQQMAIQKIRPNLGTFNAVLESLSNISSHKNATLYALKIIPEFTSLGIKPSLATFYHLINIFNNDREKLRAVFINILTYLKNNTMKIEDLKDVLFFSRAMESVCHNLRDKDLGYSLNSLLHKDDNYNFIGDSYKESIYYRNYFLLLSRVEALNVFMETYDNLVPNIYVPEPAVMNEILKSVEDNAALHLLPRLWSDIVLFEQADRNSIFQQVLQLATMNAEESLNEAMANIGWNIWEKIESSDNINIRKTMEWTGPLLGDLMIVLLANNDLSKAHLVMDKMERLQDKIIGEPNVSALMKYVDFCIQENSPDSAIKCIRYCNNVSFIETETMARKLYNTLQMKEQQIERLISIVGRDALKLKESKKSQDA